MDYLNAMVCDTPISSTTLVMEDITGNGKVDADDANIILMMYLDSLMSQN